MIDWDGLGTTDFSVRKMLLDLNDGEGEFARRRAMPIDFDDGNIYVQGTADDHFRIFRVDKDDLGSKSPEVVRF